MNKLNWLGALTVTAALLSGPAYADESTDVGDDVDDVLSLIELPEDASDTAREASAKGLDTANAAREDGRAFGQSMAEGRGEAGRERGEAARDAREGASDAAKEARDKAADMRPDNAGRR